MGWDATYPSLAGGRTQIALTWAIPAEQAFQAQRKAWITRNQTQLRQASKSQSAVAMVKGALKKGFKQVFVYVWKWGWRNVQKEVVEERKFVCGGEFLQLYSELLSLQCTAHTRCLPFLPGTIY